MKNLTHGFRVPVCYAGILGSTIVTSCRALLTLNSNGCGIDIGVKDGKVVGVRGRATDRVNKGRLGPKGLTGFVFLSLISKTGMAHRDAQLESHA